MSDRVFLTVAVMVGVLLFGIVLIVLSILSLAVPWSPLVLVAAIIAGAVVFTVDTVSDWLRRRR